MLALGYGIGASLITQAHAAVATPASAGAANAVSLPDFSSIVSQYGPAVVNVSVSGVARTGGPKRQFPKIDPDSPFGNFFRQFQQQMPQQEIPQRGLGSGFIVASDGVILTNAHVVDGADEVTVKLTDKREFKAKVVGVDKPTDVAVLKIDAHGLPTVKTGDAERAQVGQWVVAIGSPFGFENTATAGIISTKSRSLPDEGYVQFIQTDVPVNPGSSGGPLFNLNGEVIGINSQIYTGTGGFQGISFAVPINLAMQTEQQLLAHGKVERGRLGVAIQEVNQALAGAFGLKQATGALISSVEPDGPGAKAGLEPGDVILTFNGHTVADSADLPPLVAEVKPGDSATMTVWRHGKTLDITAGVGASSTQPRLVANDAEAGKGRLGLAVRPLTSEERAQANVSGGLLVENVAGPAAKAGIKPGDIVLALNGVPVDSVAQLRKLTVQDGQHLALLVQHDDAKLFIPIDVG